MAGGKGKAIYTRQMTAREQIWPEITNRHLWYRLERDGFVTMPRTMPLLMRIMDHLSGKGVPVSQVYLDIWCRAFDEGFIQLNRSEDMAYCSGFNGQRALRTWRDRVSRLAELGFIDVKPGPYGHLSYALLINPYHVVSRANNKGLLENGVWEALIIRAAEIGASDFDDLDAEGALRPEAPKPVPASTADLQSLGIIPTPVIPIVVSPPATDTPEAPIPTE